MLVDLDYTWLGGEGETIDLVEKLLWQGSEIEVEVPAGETRVSATKLALKMFRTIRELELLTHSFSRWRAARGLEMRCLLRKSISLVG